MDRERSRATVRAPLNRPGDSDRDGQARQIELVGQVVDYRLHRSRRRSIGMLIGLSGLTVRAPNSVSIREIETTLRERADWIVRTLAEWRARQRDVLPRQWITGAPILYRGSELALALFPSRKKSVAADMFNLTVRHPAPHEDSAVAGLVRHWLQAETLRLMMPLVAHFASRLSRSCPTVKLSNARTEWGSCNHRGEIRLNWRLVHLPPPLAHYVAAHEVAHLAELNHSPRFWQVVEALYPGHAQSRRTLEEWTALLDA